MSDLVLSKTGHQRHPHAIVVTVDGNYLPYGLFTFLQIRDLHPDQPFDFVIVTTAELPHHPLIDALNVRICRMSPEQVDANFTAGARITIATYFRLFISRAIPEYDRLLYLDVDIFIRRGDFAALLSADIGDHAIAGACDPAQYRRRNFHAHDMKALGLGRFKYLSAAVQLIDAKRYNDRRIGERAVELAAAQPDKMAVMDQTAINATLKGDFAELPPGWNWLYGFRTIYWTELYDPPILHFAGRRKPWNTLDGQFPVRYSAAYRKFFAQYFPDLARDMPATHPPSANRLAHVRFLITHLGGLRRLIPALDRFEDDFDIKL